MSGHADRLTDPRALAIACRYCGARARRRCVGDELAPKWHHSTRLVDFERGLSVEERARFRASQSFAVRAFGP